MYLILYLPAFYSHSIHPQSLFSWILIKYICRFNNNIASAFIYKWLSGQNYSMLYWSKKTKQLSSMFRNEVIRVPQWRQGAKFILNKNTPTSAQRINGKRNQIWPNLITFHTNEHPVQCIDTLPVVSFSGITRSKLYWYTRSSIITPLKIRACYRDRKPNKSRSLSYPTRSYVTVPLTENDKSVGSVISKRHSVQCEISCVVWDCPFSRTVFRKRHRQTLVSDAPWICGVLCVSHIVHKWCTESKAKYTGRYYI